MEGINYRFPFNPSALMTENGSIETCDIAESIAQKYYAVNYYQKKEKNRYDENYGNDVWNVEFDNGISSAVWENVFINSLKRQLSDYEHRLVNPQIKAHIVFVEHNYDTRNFTEIKKKGQNCD